MGKQGQSLEREGNGAYVCVCVLGVWGKGRVGTVPLQI